MNSCETSYKVIQSRIRAAAAQRNHPVDLLAVSKTRATADMCALAALGQRAFGENYVQEALAKQRVLADLSLEWHLIGPLQSNKSRDTARHFDWLQTLDRPKLVEPLNRFRETATPLKVLIQVNIDDEASKSGCAPDRIDALADVVAAAPRLTLRGLMAIPAPHPDFDRRRRAFARMREQFDRLRQNYPGADTLSMGMSEDFELAIAEGATMVRVGSALFEPRPR